MGPCLPLVMPVSPRSFAGFAQQCSELSCASAVLLLCFSCCCASAVLFVLSGKQPRGVDRGLEAQLLWGASGLLLASVSW